MENSESQTLTTETKAARENDNNNYSTNKKVGVFATPLKEA
jgi:hypothetical protein